MKVSQNTKCHGPTLNGASSVSISQVQTSSKVQGTGLKVRRQGNLEWHEMLTEFNKNLLIGSNFIRSTHRQMVIS
jgi:hypothetical protein